MRLTLGFALAAALAAQSAGARPAKIRVGGTVGIQQAERSAVTFGPSLEVWLQDDLYLRGEGQLEFGDLADPFGPSNVFDGPGPHVNHVLFGPVYRPERLEKYNLAGGIEFGTQILHSRFAHKHFNFEPAAGTFIQAGHALGPLDLALQLRLDLAGDATDVGPNGETVQATVFRAVLSIELPLLRGESARYSQR
jgi:hypothetical protein